MHSRKKYGISPGNEESISELLSPSRTVDSRDVSRILDCWIPCLDVDCGFDEISQEPFNIKNINVFSTDLRPSTHTNDYFSNIPGAPLHGNVSQEMPCEDRKKSCHTLLQESFEEQLGKVKINVPAVRNKPLNIKLITRRPTGFIAPISSSESNNSNEPKVFQRDPNEQMENSNEPIENQHSFQEKIGSVVIQLSNITHNSKNLKILNRTPTGFIEPKSYDTLEYSSNQNSSDELNDTYVPFNPYSMNTNEDENYLSQEIIEDVTCNNVVTSENDELPNDISNEPVVNDANTVESNSCAAIDDPDPTPNATSDNNDSNNNNNDDENNNNDDNNNNVYNDLGQESTNDENCNITSTLSLPTADNNPPNLKTIYRTPTHLAIDPIYNPEQNEAECNLQEDLNNVPFDDKLPHFEITNKTPTGFIINVDKHHASYKHLSDNILVEVKLLNRLPTEICKFLNIDTKTEEPITLEQEGLDKEMSPLLNEPPNEATDEAKNMFSVPKTPSNEAKNIFSVLNEPPKEAEDIIPASNELANETENIFPVSNEPPKEAENIFNVLNGPPNEAKNEAENIFSGSVIQQSFIDKLGEVCLRVPAIRQKPPNFKIITRIPTGPVSPSSGSLSSGVINECSIVDHPTVLNPSELPTNNENTQAMGITEAEYSVIYQSFNERIGNVTIRVPATLNKPPNINIINRKPTGFIRPMIECSIESFEFADYAVDSLPEHLVTDSKNIGLTVKTKSHQTGLELDDISGNINFLVNKLVSIICQEYVIQKESDELCENGGNCEKVDQIQKIVIKLSSTSGATISDSFESRDMCDIDKIDVTIFGTKQGINETNNHAKQAINETNNDSPVISNTPSKEKDGKQEVINREENFLAPEQNEREIDESNNEPPTICNTPSGNVEDRHEILTREEEIVCVEEASPVISNTSSVDKDDKQEVINKEENFQALDESDKEMNENNNESPVICNISSGDEEDKHEIINNEERNVCAEDVSPIISNTPSGDKDINYKITIDEEETVYGADQIKTENNNESPKISTKPIDNRDFAVQEVSNTPQKECNGPKSSVEKDHNTKINFISPSTSKVCKVSKLLSRKPTGYIYPEYLKELDTQSKLRGPARFALQYEEFVIRDYWTKSKPNKKGIPVGGPPPPIPKKTRRYRSRSPVSEFTDDDN